MQYPFFRSIRARLLLLVLISVIPVFCVVIYAGITDLRDEIANVEKNALSIVQTLGFEHERTVYSTRQLLATLAALPDVRNHNGPACDRLFASLLKDNPVYGNILAVDAQGVGFANALSSNRHSVKERKYFQDVRRTMGFSVGEYTIGATQKKPALHVAYPITNAAGQFNGAVIVSFVLARYGTMFSGAKLPPEAVLSISDHKGVRLYSSLNPGERVGRHITPEFLVYMTKEPKDVGVFRGDGVDGKKRLYVFKKCRLGQHQPPYLFIRVSFPEEQALAHVRKKLFVNVSILLAAFILAMMSAWFIGNVTVMQRLNKLVNATRLLGHGDLTARTGLKHDGDELGMVTEAIDLMAEQLEQKEAGRRKMEEALLDSEAKYRSVVENSLVGVYILQDNRFCFVNKQWCEIYGYTYEEIVGVMSPIDVACPEDKSIVEENIRKRLAGEVTSVEYESRAIKKDGRVITVHILGGTMTYKGRPAISGTVIDISDRKVADEELRASLREKEVLLKEVHHRVKNNLQVVSSLLSLQSSHIKDPVALDMFRESINRIMTMAHIHKKLYQSKNHGGIDFSAYIDELSTHLLQSYGLSAGSVVLRTDVAEIVLDINRAIPCALIINELVSNAMKHAFPDKKTGEILISMKVEGDNIILSVADTGVGFPREIEYRKTESLGMQLVTELTEQIEGTIELVGGTGTRFVVTFKKEA